MIKKTKFSIEKYIESAQEVLRETSLGFVFIKDKKCLFANKSAAIYLKKENLVGLDPVTIFEELSSEDTTKIVEVLSKRKSTHHDRFYIRAPRELRNEVLQVEIRSVECTNGMLREMIIFGAMTRMERENSPEELFPLQVMISRIHQPAILMGMDWKIIAANQPTVHLLGLTNLHEIVGLDGRKFVKPEDREALIKRYQMFEKGKIRTGIDRYNIVGPDDRPFVVEISTSLIRGRNGEPIAFLSFIRDVTEDEMRRTALIERERQLTNVFNAYPQPAYMIRRTEDNRTILEATNDRIKRLTNGAILKYIGQPMEEIFPKKTGVPSLVREVMRTGKQQNKEFLYSHGEGSREMNMIASCAKADRDLVILITTNITEIRQSQKQVRKSEHEKSIILDSLSEQVRYITGPDLTVTWANRATVLDVGLPENEIVGNHCYKVWLGRETPHKDCPVLKAYHTRQKQTTEIAGPSGRVFHITGSPILDDKGNVTALVEVVRDITEERLANQLLEEAREHLQLLNDVLTHDLNNIYQGVLIGLELLNEASGSRFQYDEQLNAIMKLVRRSISLIRKVQRLSQLETMPVNLKKIRVAETIDRVIETCIQGFPDRTIKFTVKTPDVCPTVQGDDFLFDAIFNLVHNAIKFAPEDPVKVNIIVKYFPNRQIIEIRISDYGPGMSDITKTKLFTSKIQRTSGGSGIGLTLVKRIVERYHGNVTVADRIKGKPEKGSRFTITIPAAQ